ncbi:MAG TPA: DUF6036 family nucleotidyltransferase [Planctomycetota bacterium]|jgi:hypothetical protein|nr:DUF6036 family nucleotidyltransferase [Planctomycetota bacterium]
MKHFAGKEIREFLKAVDRHLQEPCRLEIIGAAVALLCFKANSGTLDIDTISRTGKIEKACAAARKDTGLDIPVQPVSVWDGPNEYEGRLQRAASPKLRKLQILVPEKHDWALMKLVRFNQKDIDDLVEVSKSVGFRKDVLLERFLKEMTSVVLVRPSELVLSFVILFEKLYGKSEADRIEHVVRSDKRWSALLKGT